MLTAKEELIESINQKLYLIEQYEGNKVNALLSITWFEQDELTKASLAELEEIEGSLEFILRYVYSMKYDVYNSKEEERDARKLNIELEAKLKETAQASLEEAYMTYYSDTEL